VRAGRVELYLDTLREELSNRVTAQRVDAADAHAEPFETIYVGGGTPTVLPADALVALAQDLARLLCRQQHVGPDSLEALTPEFSIEANPGTIDAPLLQRLAHAGVTRLSLGVQSFSPALRAALGRRVAQREIEDALAAIAAAGWREWNLDLVFGIPGQDWPEAVADIDAAVASGPSHISLYDLTYTPAFAAGIDATFGTGARAAAGAFAEQHYSEAVGRLEAAGYHRYEVSNFALPGHECRHNQAYWRGEDYLGVGAAAVSTIGGERRANARSVSEYLARRPAEVEALSPSTRLWEKAMLGLRTSEGVEEAAILPVLDVTVRDRLLSQGCLVRCCGRLRLNKGFLDMSNTVISALLA
jgi:oxygen-independent coproporphyrinogen III oxidase